MPSMLSENDGRQDSDHGTKLDRRLREIISALLNGRGLFSLKERRGNARRSVCPSSQHGLWRRTMRKRFRFARPVRRRRRTHAQVSCEMRRCRSNYDWKNLGRAHLNEVPRLLVCQRSIRLVPNRLENPVQSIPAPAPDPAQQTRCRASPKDLLISTAGTHNHLSPIKSRISTHDPVTHQVANGLSVDIQFQQSDVSFPG